MDIASWLFEQFPLLAPLLASEALLAVMFVTLTATLVAFGVPGVLVPMSLSSGALLGGVSGILVVIAGAALGSHALFLATRRCLAERMRRRWGKRLEAFDRNIEKRGFIYLLGLRLAGAPHMLVTASSALTPMGQKSFAIATALGFLPAIALAAMAGSAL